MLAQAQARGIASALEQVALQDLAYTAEFDAILTIDAMENVPPEDWPVVLANLHRALLPGGWLYMTVEEVDDAEIERAHEVSSARGDPVVRGEVLEGDVAGYHYYPGRERVVEWFDAEDLAIVGSVGSPVRGSRAWLWSWHRRHAGGGERRWAVMIQARESNCTPLGVWWVASVVRSRSAAWAAVAASRLAMRSLACRRPSTASQAASGSGP